MCIRDSPITWHERQKLVRFDCSRWSNPPANTASPGARKRAAKASIFPPGARVIEGLQASTSRSRTVTARSPTRRAKGGGHIGPLLGGGFRRLLLLGLGRLHRLQPGRERLQLGVRSPELLGMEIT